MYIMLCRPDKNDRSLLHRREKRILARAVEAMHLVQEQDRLRAVQGSRVLGPFDHFPYILNRRFHGVKPYELSLCMVRDDVGERRFAAARRPVQQNGGDLIRLNRPAQQLAFAHNMLLAYIFIESLRAHAVRQQAAVAGLIPERK